MVDARLQGGEKRRAFGMELARPGQCRDFGVGAPGGAVAPSKTCDGSTPDTTTQPTHGLGAVVPRTASPVAMARCMNASSLSWADMSSQFARDLLQVSPE